MPGILPMKVIKVGANAQTRIAQACDRCRSKKIRCDGIRPCCSQCSNVGFECKTSDKLSRRAFPRGYTESLEERVRSLETEVRELKDLLDEKDEKIDMLSRIHSQSSQPLHLPSPRRTSTPSLGPSTNTSLDWEKDEIFKVQQSPYLLDTEGSDSYFAGTSSSRTFLEAFKQKVLDIGRFSGSISIDLLLGVSPGKPQEAPVAPPQVTTFESPPRLVSDQLINVFFQEWAPMFPILHRPTFLSLYERYVSDVESVMDKTELAQLNLVFAIAAVSSGSRTTAELNDFDGQWKAALDAVLTESSMATLQVLILAQICCAQQGDLAKLLTYKGLSTSLSARLGLHQSQKRFALGTLTCETRKKVFWSLYTVDCFTAVTLGLPKHIRDEDIQCEYPVNVDDEYITEQGFQPTLPGEFTKLSSALALFRIARILSRILEDIFPTKASYELSLKKLSDFQNELDTWSSSLAPHLRLEFVQDKPSTKTTSSRSPLLSLVYHYTRALVDRPAICASLGIQHSSSMISHANSCKHIVQIVQLLEERGMCFAFCGRKEEVLVVAGIGLLSQSLHLDADSKLLKDNKRMVKTVSRSLTRDEALCAQEFARLVRQLDLDGSGPNNSRTTRDATSSPLSREISSSPMTINPLPSLPSATRKQLKAIASRFSASNNRMPNLNGDGVQRRPSLPTISLQPNVLPIKSRSLPENRFKSNVVRDSHCVSSPRRSSAVASQIRSQPSTQVRNLNLDYLSFGSDSEVNSESRERKPIKRETQSSDWERLLGSMDNGDTNIYDACYGGQPVEALLDPPVHAVTDATSMLTVAESTSWQTSTDMWSQLCQNDSNSTIDSVFSNINTGSNSILSFSSCDDLSAGRSGSEDLDWISSATDDRSTAIHEMNIPAGLDPEDATASPWDAVLAL